MRREKTSFTLLELLIVVIIIGILVAIGLPQMQKAIYKSKISEVCNVVNAIVKAKTAYYLQNGNYYGGIGYEELGAGKIPGASLNEQQLGIEVSSKDFNYLVYPSTAYPAVASIYVKPPGCASWVWRYNYTGTKGWYNYGTSCPYNSTFPDFPLDCKP